MIAVLFGLFIAFFVIFVPAGMVIASASILFVRWRAKRRHKLELELAERARKVGLV